MSGRAGAEAEPERGWIDREVLEELPELRLWSLRVEASPGRSTPGLKQRLRLLSDRFHGAKAVQLRTDPVPHAYRVFFRHVGLDPDTDRTPVEAAALDRLVKGGFESRGLVEDARLVALAETGVPLWAFDDDRLDGPLGIRAARAGERIGRSQLASDARPGRLVVADAGGPVAGLFSDPAPAHAVGRATRAIRLVSVQVAGVPQIHVEESLWLCAEALDSGPP